MGEVFVFSDVGYCWIEFLVYVFCVYVGNDSVGEGLVWDDDSVVVVVGEYEDWGVIIYV